MNNRPDGENARAAAWLLFSVGALALLVGLILPTEQYGELLPRNVLLRWWLQAAGAFALQASLLVGLTGMVIRALWFLPGRDYIPDESALHQQAAEETASSVETQVAAQPSNLAFVLIVGGSALVLLTILIIFAAAL